MGARGTKPDTVTIGGITRTYEEWGKIVGIKKEGFRHRVIRLGVDHPDLLLDRAASKRKAREQAAAKNREHYIEKHGMTPEERREKMRQFDEARWNYSRREKRKEKSLVLRVGSSGSVDGMMAEDGTDNDDWRSVCNDELRWREMAKPGRLRKAQSDWARLIDGVIDDIDEFRDKAPGVYNLVVALAKMERDDLLDSAV